MTAEDALEYLIVGATMVAVGTANFIDPRAPLNVLEGIKKYMRENKVKDIKQVIFLPLISYNPIALHSPIPPSRRRIAFWLPPTSPS